MGTTLLFSLPIAGKAGGVSAEAGKVAGCERTAASREPVPVEGRVGRLESGSQRAYSDSCI